MAADLAAALREVRPEGEASTLGNHFEFRSREVTPAHTYEAAVADFGGRLVEVSARDSYDERPAAFLLDAVAEVSLPGARSLKIRMSGIEYPPLREFDDIVIVPPPIARRFDHESAALHTVTYRVVPAFGGEFADGDDGPAFWWRFGRNDGWGLAVIRWDRARKLRKTFGTSSRAAADSGHGSRFLYSRCSMVRGRVR